MAKRMLSLLLAVVMVLGMVPSVNLSASAEEAATITPAVSTPIWSADFDDASKVYDAANSDTVTNSVWSTYTTSVYNFSFPEKTPGDKYMTIVSGKTDTSEAPFELGSTVFSAADGVFVTMDLLRPVSGKDGIKILINDEDGKALAHLIIDWENKIQYDLKGGTSWVDSGISAPYGSEWFTLSIAALQSETEGEDQLIITCGEHTATVKGTFASAKGAARLLLQAQGKGYNKASHSEARNLDNIAVYAYAPATGVSFTESAYIVEAGATVQTAAVVAPAVTYPAVKITYSSDNETVATIDENGFVTGVAAGEATITATVANLDGSYYTDAVQVRVNDGDSTLLWRDDFDDAVITPADGQYSNTDKWSTADRGSYNFRVMQDPKNASNKMLHITSNGPVQPTKGFNYTSASFAGPETIEFTFDANLNRKGDWFRISVNSTEGKTLISVVIWDNGGIAYATKTANTWSDNVGSITYGEEHTFRIVVLQKAGTDNDLWQLWVDGKLLTQQTSFIQEYASTNELPAFVKMFTSNSSSGNYTVQDTYIDNMEVRAYTPVPATEIVVPETLKAELDRTTQLTVTAKPAEADLYRLGFVSDNPDVASVDANGNVTGVGEGSANITVTLTNANGTTCTKTVAVTVVPANALVWEEDFDDKEIGSTGEFDVINTNPSLGSISVQDVTELGGSGNALVMNRDDGGLFTLNGGFQLPVAATKMVLEYRIRNLSNDHQNTVLPTLAGAHSNSKRFLSVFINEGTLFWNNGDWREVQALSNQKWYTIKIIIDTEAGCFQMYLDGKFVAGENRLLNDNSGNITHVYFQSSTSDDQDMGDGLWMDDFKVYVYTPIEGLELLDESMTLEGQSSAQIRVQTTPADANGQIIWTSSDESIAVVDGNGVVTGVTSGTVTITASTFEGYKDTMQVTVKEVKPTGITVDQTSLSLPVGAHTYIHAEAYPIYATPNVVTMASSDESVVAVDEWGEVVCLKAGTAKLILTCSDVKVEVPVTVTEAGIMETIQVSPNAASVAAALARIAEINATAEGMTGNIEVVLAGGYYYLTDTIRMNETHGGTNGYSVIWKAAEGATPILGGAKHIAGSQFADADGDGIYTIDLGALGIPKVADPDTMSTTRQLFVNNVRATRARSQGGLTNAAYWMDGSTNLGHTSDALLEGLSLAEDFKRPQDLEFVYQELWSNPRCGVDGIIDNHDGTVSIKMDQPGWRYCVGKGNSAVGADGPVWIENALELLDEPGEWYLDEETQILYYMPRTWEDMDEVTFTLPLLDSHDPEGGVAGLMYIAGTDYDNMVHNIHFEGITFADTTWNRPSTTYGHSDTQNNHLRETGDYLTEASVTVTRANGICFTGCTFTRLGITAVKMVKGVQNSFFVGNHFYDISGGAINIGEPNYADENVSNPSDKRMMMKNDDVLNNYIHDIGVDFNSSAAISLGFGPNMDFSYNEIFNMPYSGFHIGYGWSTKFATNLKNLVVSNNFIHDFMGDGVADGGGVYTLGNSGGDDNNYNKIHSNYVKTVLDDSGPLYMDNGATYYEVYNNLVDLSKVTDWSGNTSISWLQMNTGASQLKVHDNYTTVYKYNDYSEDSEIEPGHLETAGQWSDAAQAIIDGAGLQSEYAHLRNGHAELIVTNLDEIKEMTTGESFQISVSYTDGKDKPVSGGNYIVAYDSKDPEIAQVSADGLIVAKSSGITTVRVWVISNEILDVIEHTVVVGDELASVMLKDVERDITMSTSSTGWQLTTMIISKLGRILTPNSVTFGVADTSIATVTAEGFLAPVSAGTTSLTVVATYGGMSIARIFKVVINAPAGITESDVADMFDKEQEESWIRSNAVNWEVIDDTSVTGTLSSYATFSGTKYGSELLCFKLKIDKVGISSNWPAIVLRAQGSTGEAQTGATDAYMFCMGSNGVEVYRFVNGVRYVIRGNQADDGSSVIRLSGAEGVISPEASGFTYTNDVAEHDIKVGAIADGGNVRILLYVDGKNVLDYLDTASSGAISAPGYFGMIGRGQTFTLTKAAYIVPAGAVESNAGDMFDKEQEESWIRSNATNWEVVDDTSVTGTFSSYATFSGKQYNKELLSFKLKIDKVGISSNWPAIVLRAQGSTGEAQTGATDAYMFCMGSNGVEVYRFVNGVRYVIRGDQADDGSSVIRLSGAEGVISPEASGFTYTDDIAEHDIKVGAIADGGNVRILLYVDGNKVLDYLDTAASGAIATPGYFGMIGRGQTFTLTKDTSIPDDTGDGENDDVVDTEGKAALIGDSVYETLEEALAAATAGDTVKLLADAEVTEIILSDKIILDLNGYELTAGYLVAFGNSKIIDSAPGAGLLKSKHVRLDADNPMMPVWDSQAGGYRFFTMVDSQAYRSQSADNFVFIAKPILGSIANDVYMAMAGNGLTVKAKMTWKANSENEVEQLFVLKTEDVQTVYSTEKIIQMTVSGTANYVGRLSTTMVIESDTGVVWEADPLPYIGE